MSNSSRKNRNRPVAGTVQLIGTEMAAGYDPPGVAAASEAHVFAAEEFADKVAALPAVRGVVDLGSTAADRTPRSGRPIGLAPLIGDALDDLTAFRICGSCGGTGTRYNGGAWGGECGCPQDPIECVAELLTGCIGIPHSSVFNPVTEYVRKQVPNLDTVFTTATEIVAERGDIRARVTLPEYVADFLLTYDTVDGAFPALVMATGPAVVEVGEEVAAA